MMNVMWNGNSNFCTITVQAIRNNFSIAPNATFLFAKYQAVHKDSHFLDPTGVSIKVVGRLFNEGF